MAVPKLTNWIGWRVASINYAKLSPKLSQPLHKYASTRRLYERANVDIRLLTGNDFTQFINGLFEMSHFHFQFYHPIHAQPLFI